VKKNGLTVVDFFCGAGGFSEGFRQLGFEIVQGYDNWQPAIDTFNHNYKLKSETKDILTFKNSIDEINNIPNTDVIVGSPPCVTFSSSNNSGKANKSSGLTLIKTFLRIVAIKKFQKNSKLKAWFMENVPNSRKYLPNSYTFEDLDLSDWSILNGFTPNQIAITLENNQPLINAADYGSYQARKRVISGEIIHLGRLSVPECTHHQSLSEVKSNKLQWNVVGDLLIKMPPPNSSLNTSSISDPLYPKITISLTSLSDHFYDSGLYSVEWKKSREHKLDHPYMGKMSFPEDLNKPSRTVTATKSGSSRESLIYKSEFKHTNDGEYRTPTVREAASIMGFPYTYQFKGSVFNKWRLVGNAVCPAVSRAFAKELLLQLNYEVPKELILSLEPNLTDIPNLNTFRSKVFDNPPRKIKNSKFRKHIFKSGNLTVTLSNYDIANRGIVDDLWKTSIQYGTGEGAPMQHVDDNFYIEIEPIVNTIQNGPEYVEKINNGFSEKIGSARELQVMHEQGESFNYLLEPSELINQVKELILEANVNSLNFNQEELKIFKHKKIIPAHQLFALYAVNKISTIANSKNNMQI
jgi:DNA (cytosine-5)-methyltransferase 1